MKCQFCDELIIDGARFCSKCGRKQEVSVGVKIDNYDALVRRANKIVDEYNRYPLMPKGDYSIDYIKNVFNYKPLFVLDNLKKLVMDTLLEVTQFRYDEKELLPILDATYGKNEEKHKIRILKILIDNYKVEAQNFQFKHWDYMMLRTEETLIFYYAFSIFYIARDLNNSSGLFFSRTVLKAIDLLYCEKGTNPIVGLKQTGKFLNISRFAEDKVVYQNLLQMIEFELENSFDEEVKKQLMQIKAEERKSSKGCYIATCVYGSYDCPEVWTLRRYRDCCLSKNILGKLFIFIYYKVSPLLVKVFGNNKSFRNICRVSLDYMIKKLHILGFDNSPYDDSDAL